MSWWMYVVIAVLVLLLLLLLWWLFQKKRQAEENPWSFGEEEDGWGEEFSNAESEAMRSAREEREAQQRQGQVAELLGEADPRIRKLVYQLAGATDLRDNPVSSDIIRQIARQIDPIHLGILSAGSNPHARFDLDLKEATVREPVDYPSDAVERQPMVDFAQLPQVVLDEVALDDDAFYTKMATDGLTVDQHYDEQSVRRRLYILLDISTSMDEMMADQVSRRVWSLGVCLNLMFQALDNNAQYVFTPFAGQPVFVQRVDGPPDAQALVDWIMRAVSDGSGTNIMAALHRAASDIQADDSDIPMSELLLISDCEDSSLDPVIVGNLLGNDIRLHVAMIGGSSDALQQVAASYRVFN